MQKKLTLYAIFTTVLLLLSSICHAYGDDNVEVSRVRNLQRPQMARTMPVDVSRLKNLQRPQMARTMPVDVARLRNLRHFNMSEFVPFIEVGGCDSYRISGTVFGTANVTSVGGVSNCTVEFQVMASNGTVMHQESLNSSLEANVETPILFAWASGELPVGDYYSRLVVWDELGSLVYDTSWFYAFSVTEPIFVYDFGSFHEYDYKIYSPPSPPSYMRGEQVVFNFSLSVSIGYLGIRVEGSKGSDFLLEIGNETIEAVADVYLRNSSHYLTFYNTPKGDYQMIFNVASPTAKITELSLETFYKADPFLWHELRDEVSAIDKLTSLSDTKRTFSLIATYISNRTEPLELTITNSTGGQIVQLRENTTLLQQTREVHFFFNLTFPSDPVTTDLTFNLTFAHTEYSTVWTVPFVARKCPYTIDLQASGPVETRYYKVDGGLSLFKKPMPHVGKDDIEALVATNIEIVDLGVNETDATEPLKNVTVRFTVENKYVKSTPWGWSYYTYYDLYVYPVIGPNGNHIDQPRSLVVYKEVEQVLVKGVPVTYQGNEPQVHLSIRFVKSKWPNVIDWIFRRFITMLPIPAYPSGTISKLAMWTVNYFYDRAYGQTSADILLNIQETVLSDAGQIILTHWLEEKFGTGDLETICLSVPAYAVAMLFYNEISDEEPGIGLQVLRALTVSALKVLWKKPWVMRKILDQVWQKVLSIKFPDTVPYKALSKAAQQLLFIAAAAEALVDCIIDVLAPAKEIKEIVWSNVSQPELGNFTNINLGDPLVSVSFSGLANQSSLFETRLYSLSKLKLNVTGGANQTARFEMTVTPQINYAGVWKSLLYDEIGRSQLIVNFGIFPQHSIFREEDGLMTVEGNGTLSSQYEKLLIDIENEVVTGVLQQPFLVDVINGTAYMNLTTLYPFGSNLTYTVELQLPPDAKNINVLYGTNHTIQDNTVIWSFPIDRIEVRYTQGPFHSIAITNLTIPEQTITPGETIPINVTLQNFGNFTEAFNASLYYTRISDPLIGTQNVTLAEGANTTLTFEWTPNMTGRYQILANTTEILNDFDPTDNTRTTILYVGYGGANPGSESVNGLHMVSLVFAMFASVIVLAFRKNREMSLSDMPASILKQNLHNNQPSHTTNMWQDRIRQQPI